MRRGCFIAFEGQDNQGKTTQGELLYNYLLRISSEQAKASNLIQFVSFPNYNSPTGEKLKRALNGNPDRFNPEEIRILFSMNKLEAIPNIMRTLVNGGIVIADRWLLSAAAYNSANAVLKNNKTLPDTYVRYMEMLCSLEHEVFQYGIPTEDITYIFRGELPKRESYNDFNDKNVRLQEEVAKGYNAILHFAKYNNYPLYEDDFEWKRWITQKSTEQLNVLLRRNYVLEHTNFIENVPDEWSTQANIGNTHLGILKNLQQLTVFNATVEYLQNLAVPY